MRIKSAILAAPFLMLVAGCSSPYAEKQQACVAQYPRSMVQRVECFNRLEEGTSSHADVRAQRQQVALALAKKVDSGELTQKEADRRYTLFILDLIDSHGRVRDVPTQMTQGFLFPPNTFTMSDEMRELINSRRR